MLRSRARALAGVRARGLVSRRVAQEVERRETDGCPLRARAACQQCIAHDTINTGVNTTSTLDARAWWRLDLIAKISPLSVRATR